MTVIRDAPTSRKVLPRLLQFAVSIVCLVAAFLLVPVDSLHNIAKTANLLPLAVAFCLVPPAVLLRAWRWQIILKRAEVDMPLKSMLRLTLIGQALNLVLPACTGDVARSYYAWKEAGQKEVMLASAVVDKVIALFTLCLIGILCAFLIEAYSLAITLLVASLPFGLVFLFPRLVPWRTAARIGRRWVRKEVNVPRLVKTFSLDKVTFLRCMAISAMGWILTNMVYFCAWLAFDPTTPLAYTFAIAPLINIVRILPISVSGLGSADLLIVFLLGIASIEPSTALMGSMIVNVALIAAPGLLGAAFIAVQGKRASSGHRTSESKGVNAV